MNRYKESSDNELIELVIDDDKTAFAEIYKRYWGILFQHARKMLQDDDAAKDIVQDVFTTLWARRNDLDLRSKLSSYLYGAIRYQVFNLIDKEKVKGNYLQSIETFIDHGEYTTDDRWLEKELALQIEQEINSLPAKMKEIFILSRSQYLTHREIAQKLNISDQTVKKQVHYAIKILRPKFRLYILVLYMIHWL